MKSFTISQLLSVGLCK